MLKFGRLLRHERLKAHRSMREVANQLRVSVMFMSDVELGRRAPFSVERIIQTAVFLGISATPLLVAAARERGTIELAIQCASAQKLEMGATLVRNWGELTDDQVIAIAKIIEGRVEEKRI